MSRTAARIVVIAYAFSLLTGYLVTHPPEWIERLAITTRARQTITILGHRISFRITVRPRRPPETRLLHLTTTWPSVPAAVCLEPFEEVGR